MPNHSSFQRSIGIKIDHQLPTSFASPPQKVWHGSRIGLLLARPSPCTQVAARFHLLCTSTTTTTSNFRFRLCQQTLPLLPLLFSFTSPPPSLNHPLGHRQPSKLPSPKLHHDSGQSVVDHCSSRYPLNLRDVIVAEARRLAISTPLSPSTEQKEQVDKSHLTLSWHLVLDPRLVVSFPPLSRRKSSLPGVLHVCWNTPCSYFGSKTTATFVPCKVAFPSELVSVHEVLYSIISTIVSTPKIRFALNYFRRDHGLTSGFVFSAQISVSGFFEFQCYPGHNIHPVDRVSRSTLHPLRLEPSIIPRHRRTDALHTP